MLDTVDVLPSTPNGMVLRFSGEFGKRGSLKLRSCRFDSGRHPPNSGTLIRSSIPCQSLRSFHSISPDSYAQVGLDLTLESPSPRLR